VLGARNALAGEGHLAGAATWLALATLLAAAKLGGEIATRVGQPAVLGELSAGILLGNLDAVGVPFLAPIAQSSEVHFAAELGVILLLFQVGLESSLAEMRRVVGTAGLVAMVGVFLPMTLGVGASRLFLPAEAWSVHLFVGATLAATSVGITARVLKDLGAEKRSEARIILGAAVLDDVLGLVVLAVVAAIGVRGQMPPIGEVASIFGLASAFLVGAIAVGYFAVRGIYRSTAKFRTAGVLGVLSVALALLFSGVAAAAGLAPIVGAFAAGLLLDEVSIRSHGSDGLQRLEAYVSPLVGLLAPIFFVRTGMSVHIAGISGRGLLLAAVLFVVAVVGKIAAGFVVGTRPSPDAEAPPDRLLIGLGMVPRGEVGLIFASTGAAIVTPKGPLLADDLTIALVLAVMATTVVVPPLLAARLRVLEGRNASSDPTV
jgi:Kef-type K+ transport system membrane component KefB